MSARCGVSPGWVAELGAHRTERLASPTFQLAEEAVQAVRAMSRLGCRDGDLCLQLVQSQGFNVVTAVNKRTTRATVTFASHVTRLGMRPLGPGTLHVFGSDGSAHQAVVRVLVGEVKPSGKIPVTITEAPPSSKVLFLFGFGLALGG